MKYLARHDFNKSQPRNVPAAYGKNNEGFIVEGNTPKEAIELWNSSQLSGNQLNSFYIKLTEIKGV